VELAAGAQVLLPQQLERALGGHRIRCEVDPDGAIAEGCELFFQRPGRALPYPLKMRSWR
jgi:hypothetical protein